MYNNEERKAIQNNIDKLLNELALLRATRNMLKYQAVQQLYDDIAKITAYGKNPKRAVELTKIINEKLESVNSVCIANIANRCPCGLKNNMGGKINKTLRRKTINEIKRFAEIDEDGKIIPNTTYKRKVKRNVYWVD